jgi:hypothetical protein
MPSHTITPPTPEQALYLLSFLPERPDYGTWIRCIAALGNTFDESTALALLRSRFQDEKPDEHAYHVRHRLASVGFGTLVFLAKRYGFRSASLMPAPNKNVCNVQSAYRGLQRCKDSPNQNPHKNTAPAFSFADADTTMLQTRFCNDFLEDLVQECGLPREQVREEARAFGSHTEERLYHIAINHSVVNKTTNYEALNARFENTMQTSYDIARAIRQGFAVCCSVLKSDANGAVRRKNENWCGSELIALDIDGGMTIEECLHIPYTQNALLLYTSCSHSVEQHRFRLIFDLPYFETNVQRYAAIVARFIKLYGADEQRKDVCGVFFGNTNARIYNLRTGEVL